MTEDRLEKLRKKHRQLGAKIQAQEARERAKKRKEDTRRKVIVGALAMSYMDEHKDSEFAKIMAQLIETKVTRATERKLFELAPLASNTQNQDLRETFRQTEKPQP